MMRIRLVEHMEKIEAAKRLAAASKTPIEVVKINNTGTVGTEYVELKINRDCDLGDYLITDTTYDAHGHPSNKHRHVFFFQKLSVSAGDQVILHTGTASTTSATTKGDSDNCHNIYWSLNEIVWNKAGDCAYLLHAPRAERIQVRVGEKK